MVTLFQLRSQLRHLLRQTPNALFDCDCIIGAVCRLTQAQILMGGVVTPQEEQKCVDLALRRAKGEPLQYLLGVWDFYGLSFSVGKGVLIPRPDTETLVDAALKTLLPFAGQRVVDLCSGTGCVAAAIAVNAPNIQVCAVENYSCAMKYLTCNLNKLAPSVQIFEMDVFEQETVKEVGLADMIVCNPPYLTDNDMQSLQLEVRHEPACALHGGKDGLKYYRTIPLLWKKALNPRGVLLFEIGKGQQEEVIKQLQFAGYDHFQLFSDAANIVRVVGGQKKDVG